MNLSDLATRLIVLMLDRRETFGFHPSALREELRKRNAAIEARNAYTPEPGLYEFAP